MQRAAKRSRAGSSAPDSVARRGITAAPGARTAGALPSGRDRA